MHLMHSTLNWKLTAYTNSASGEFLASHYTLWSIKILLPFWIRFAVVSYRFPSCFPYRCWDDRYQKSPRFRRFKSDRDEIRHNCFSSEDTSTDGVQFRIRRHTCKIAVMTSFRETSLPRCVWHIILAVCATVSDPQYIRTCWITLPSTDRFNNVFIASASELQKRLE